MKVFNFNNWDEFLNKFDGEIHAIVDKNDKYICDLHESDLVRFYDEGKLVGDGNYILENDKFRQEILSEEIIINIRNK